MNDKDRKEAYRLWKGFRTGTVAYRKLAEKYGMRTTDLNALCWEMDRSKRLAREGKGS